MRGARRQGEGLQEITLLFPLGGDLSFHLVSRRPNRERKWLKCMVTLSRKIRQTKNTFGPSPLYAEGFVKDHFNVN